MAPTVSRQNLLDQIVSLGMELFKRKLISNPNKILGNVDIGELCFGIKTQEFYCVIHKFEKHRYVDHIKEPWIYYVLRFSAFSNINPGFDGTLVIDDIDGSASFYISDDNNGIGNVEDDFKLNACLSLIIRVFSELLEN